MERTGAKVQKKSESEREHEGPRKVGKEQN